MHFKDFLFIFLLHSQIWHVMGVLFLVMDKFDIEILFALLRDEALDLIRMVGGLKSIQLLTCDSIFYYYSPDK